VRVGECCHHRGGTTPAHRLRLPPAVELQGSNRNQRCGACQWVDFRAAPERLCSRSPFRQRVAVRVRIIEQIGTVAAVALVVGGRGAGSSRRSATAQVAVARRLTMVRGIAPAVPVRLLAPPGSPRCCGAIRATLAELGGTGGQCGEVVTDALGVASCNGCGPARACEPNHGARFETCSYTSGSRRLAVDRPNGQRSSLPRFFVREVPTT
jgi:hypothetical protein